MFHGITANFGKHGHEGAIGWDGGEQVPTDIEMCFAYLQAVEKKHRKLVQRLRTLAGGDPNTWENDDNIDNDLRKLLYNMDTHLDYLRDYLEKLIGIE